MILLIYIVFLFTSLQLAESAPLSWPVGKYYECIGKASGNSVFAPVDVVDYLSKSLSGDPSKWYVRNYHQGEVPAHNIAIIVDRNENSFVFSITSDTWILLNKGDGQGAISKIMEDAFRSPPLYDVKIPKKTDFKEWLKYFELLCPLYEGYPTPVILSGEYGKSAEITNYGSAYGFSFIQLPAKLKALWNDPIIHDDGETYSVSIHVLNASGSVENWSVTFQKNSLKIEHLNVTVLYPPHSYSYILPPG